MPTAAVSLFTLVCLCTQCLQSYSIRGMQQTNMLHYKHGNDQPNRIPYIQADWADVSAVQESAIFLLK